MTSHLQKSSRRHFCRMSTVSVFATTLGCGSFLNQGVSETLFFSACTDLYQQHYIAAVDTYGQLYFKLPIPFRAHDSVCIETTGQVVFFGRNPGDRFCVVSVEQKKIVREVLSTQYAPFSGHGVLVKNHLYVSENATHHGNGSIGIYDIEGNFERVGEVSSFGVEPHQIQVLPDQKTLVVANGGLRRDQQLDISNIADFSSNIR